MYLSQAIVALAWGEHGSSMGCASNIHRTQSRGQNSLKREHGPIVYTSNTRASRKHRLSLARASHNASRESCTLIARELREHRTCIALIIDILLVGAREHLTSIT